MNALIRKIIVTPSPISSLYLVRSSSIPGRNLVPSSSLLALQQQQRYFAQQQGQIHPGYKKIKEQYKKFQVDDGVPVHLKGGPFDRFLYYGTLLGIGIGLIMFIEYVYSAAFPKKE